MIKNSTTELAYQLEITQPEQVEEKYRQLLEDMNDGYLVVQEGEIVFTNRKLEEIIGNKPVHELERVLVEFMTPDDCQEAKEQYERVMRGDEKVPEKRESVLLKEDGTTITIESSIKAVQYEGKPAFSIILRDITDRKLVEERYRRLLEDMNDGYGVIQDERYVFANSRLAELFGCELNQILGKSIAEFMMPEERQEAMESYDRVMCGDQVYDMRYEGEMIRGDEAKIALESSVKPIEYKGRPAFSVIIRDITERKRAEEKYRQLLEDMSDGYVVIQDGKYVFANRRFTDMMGYEPEQLAGMSPFMVAHSDKQQELTELYEIIQRDEQAYTASHEIEAKRADGTEIVVEASIKVIHYEDKPALYAIVRDITERKQMEEELRQHKEHLEELVKVRTAELARQSDIVRRQAEEILEISTPVMQVSKGVMLAPLIGVLDSQRTQQFMERLLDSIAETSSHIALIDITGVPTIDTQTAQHLIETISAVRMLGSDVILTGVRPAIAQALVHLGVDISGLTTRSSLAAGLKVALDRLNKQHINDQETGLMGVI